MRLRQVILTCLLLLVLSKSTAMDTDSTKTIKAPQFSGKQEEFQIWWMRFKAFAMLMKFAQAIGEQKEASLPDDELEATADTNEKKAARARNLKAMYYFTLTFQTEALMGMIFKAYTIKWPSGEAWKVVKTLFDKYGPKDTISCVELRLQLTKIGIKNNESPSLLFKQISAIRNRFQNNSYNISEDELIAAPMAAAPDQYHSIVTSTQITKGNALTLQDVKMAMAHARWC